MNPSSVVSVQYTYLEIVEREVGGGIAFFLCLFLAISFGAYTYRFWRRSDPVSWAALGLTTFVSGSCLRNFLNWMQFLFEHNGWSSAPWTNLWPWLGVAVLLNMVGAGICLRVLSPEKRARWVVWAALLIAFAVPTLTVTLL